jgi:nicotinic acid mononucleotide adenylyltransferase
VAGVGAYPGSFNPPTVAHLAIAEAAVRQAGLRRVDLIVSRTPLGKGDVARPTFEDRVAVLEAIAAARSWLGVRVTDGQLLADISAGYDAVIVGADKWAQVMDPAWYGGSVVARDAAVARLPRVLLAPRSAFPADGLEQLRVAPHHLDVSSTAVRAGRREWMAPEAAAFDAETGAWSDPVRYERWRCARPG